MMPHRPQPGRVAGLLRLGLKRIRIDGAVLLILVFVVALISFGVAALPRFMATTSDTALHQAIGQVGLQQRNITFSRIGRILGNGPKDPFGRVVEQGDELASELEGDLAEAISGSNFVVTAAPFEVYETPEKPQNLVNRWFRFRYQQDISDQMTLVSGALPSPTGPIEFATDCDATEEDDVCDTVEVPVYQTAITQETADWMRVEVSDRVVLRPQRSSALNARVPLNALDYQLVLEVSGIVSLSDPAAELWQGDTRLHEPGVAPAPLGGFYVFAMGVLADGDYERLLADTSPTRFQYDWRYFVDFETINASDIGVIDDEVKALQLVYQSRPGFESPSFRTGIGQIAEDFEIERNLAISMSSLVLFGLLGLVVIVIVVLAALAAKRREANTVLVRSRGAGARSLIAARLLEGIVLFVPATAIGVLLARSLVSGRDGSGLLVESVLVTIGVAIVFVLLALPSISSDLGQLLVRRARGRSGVTRVVIEILLLAVGAGAGILLNRRGIDPGDSGSGFDPLLAMAPLLIGMAAGVILLRIAPRAARLASSAGSRARGVVAMIGFRSLETRSLPAQLPSVVILIGVALVVFGSIQIATINSTQIAGTWQMVGANYRLEPSLAGATLSPDLVLDPSGLDIAATADAALMDGQVEDRGVLRGSLQVLALDLGDYAAVGAGTPADPVFPNEMSRAVTSGGSGEPLPAIVSKSWPVAGPHVGDTVDLAIGRSKVAVRVVAVREVFPGLDPDRPFVVVDRSGLGAVGRIDVTPTRRYVDAPDSVSAEIIDDVEAQARGALVVSRPDLQVSLADSPTLKAIVLINAIALWLAILLAVAAAITGFVLTSERRTRDFGFLRAVGLTRRQMAWALVAEQIPPAVLASAIGIITGVGLAFFIEPNLNTTSLTGTTLNPEITLQWGTLTLSSVLILVSVLAATAIYSYAQRDLDLATVLRRGDRT